MADAAPADPADPASSFHKHDPGNYGAFSVDLSLSARPVAAKPPTAPLNNAAAAAGASANLFCTSSNSFCFQATIDAATGNAIITLQTQSNGWASVGVGCKTMACQNIYIGWRASGGASIVSQRSATGSVSPTISAKTDFTMVSNPTDATIYPTSTFSVSFMLPKASISTTSAMDFIYAFGPSPPANPDSPTANIAQHATADRGTFSLNLATGETAVVAPLINYALIHGIIMFIAWGVIPFISIFIARYLKAKLGHLWYILHMSLGITILILTTTAIILIELEIIGPLSVRFNSSLHAYAGAVLVFGMMPAQIILGYVSNHLFSPDRSSVPWWDQVHWWLGRMVVVFSWVVIFMGLVLFESTIVIKALFVAAILVW
ncbi:hypothetical protein BDR26DRAFT_600845 [Obelidium mucronatum]|nr:hypothetical protein BDR26DRAFT_600845 [Obelidium mucronatum]